MPAVATSGFTNRVINVNDRDYQWSRADTLIAVLTLTATRTFTLPGPTSEPDQLPAPGDYYELGDPLGVFGTHSVIVDGGGYPVQGGDTITFDEDWTHVRFTFVATPGVDPGGAWLVGFCSCGGGG